MRTILALVLSVLLPARGKRRAGTVETLPAESAPRTAPVRRRAFDAIDAGASPMVRPYLIAWERQQREREAQRERRTAALAACGVDYPYGPQGSAA
jgi:hypothetical protein